MIKVRYFAFPVLLIIFFALRAVRFIASEASTNITGSSIDNVVLVCITIGVSIILSLFLLTEYTKLTGI